MKTTRKKMLLSSIAMLLVALVALGSATYAWFTINKSVQAKTIKVTAATSKGLQITKDDGTNWGRTVEFKATSTLNPVSYAYTNASAAPATGAYPEDVTTAGVAASATNTGSWKTANVPAVSKQNVTVGSDTFSEAVSTPTENGYFAAYRVGIKSKSGAIAKSVSAELTKVEKTSGGTNATKSFAKAIVVYDGTAAATTWGTDVVKLGVGDAYTSATHTSGAYTEGSAVVAGVATDNNIQASVDASTVYYYTVLCWFEGNDTDCDDDGQGQTAEYSLTFTLNDN
jgi:hypothetical protein